MNIVSSTAILCCVQTQFTLVLVITLDEEVGHHHIFFKKIVENNYAMII